ncbi:glycosyltransferase [filamentous cyanobacterium LEGE 11480]|uniref:Glycosyltransferase n=2 Tax=Romeriopsis TaxID=2992131 RepID=A0A928VJY6_9CYAN|nr:glycosyltransferase [Romeriopsis navalis LEGE 11480]
MDWWSHRNRYYHQDLAQLHGFLIPTGATVLEIGCGTGDLLASVQPSTGVGIDFSQALISLAQEKHPHLQFVCADAEDFCLDPDISTFDYILLSDTLGHLSDIQQVLQHLQVYCHPRTRIILTFHNFLWQPLLNLAEKVGQRRPQPPQSWLSMSDVRNLLSITGYESVKIGRRFLFPKRIPGLAQLCNRILVHLPGIQHLGLTNYIVARPRPTIDPNQTAPTCSVVIPARNEAGNIQAAIDRLPVLGSQTEVIFVEGHSRDQTWAEIQRVVAQGHPQHRLKAFQQTGRGKVDAVRLGFGEATGDILMILDADLTVQPEDLPHFFDVVASRRGDFANGTRLVYPRSGAAMPWLNNLANKFFSLAFSFLLDQPLKDTLCGTKVIWREDYVKLVDGRSYFGDFDPFGDFDLLFGAAKLNLRIVDVPVRYQPRTYGESNIAHFREGLVLLKMCLYALRKIKFV